MDQDRSRAPLPRRGAALPRGSRTALLALALVVAPACDDPTCVFAGNCFTTPGAAGALGVSAVAPVDGELVARDAPTVVTVAPDGGMRHPDTAVAIVFSESMAPDSVLTAFAIVDDTTGVALPSQGVLAGDGRVLVLFPTNPLPAGTYSVELGEDESPLDLTGQQLGGADGSLALFDVPDAMMAPAQPEVVLLFPLDGSTNESPTGEVVCVFDREVAPPANLVSGWDVVVRPMGGMADAPPAFDPPPTPLTLAGFLGFPIEDRRLWTWRSTDGTDPQRLVTSGGAVTVTVSQSGGQFADAAAAMQLVDETSSTYTVSRAPRPMGALLNPGKDPDDAIGIANLEGASAADDLELQVEFEADDQAMGGDVLTVFLFGLDPADTDNVIAFERSVVLPGTMPLASTTVGRVALDLALSTTPVEGRFADGPVRFAMRLERGDDEGWLRVLDVDLIEPDVQDPVLDTERPELLLLDGQAALTDEYRSDVVDLAVLGHADVGLGDFVRGVLVETGMGDNAPAPGAIPPALGSAPALIDAGMGNTVSSFFLAAPVALGRRAVGAGTVSATVTIFDRALNAASTSLVVPFRQVGAVGATPLDPMDAAPLLVEVFDAETLAHVQGALVYAHAEVSDGMGGFTHPLLGGGPAATGMDGTATVPHHGPGQAATLVTVVAGGYDVLTFHGVPSTALSVPLVPAQQVLARETSSVAVATGVGISTLVRRVGDTRRAAPAFPTVNTLGTPGTTEFDFDVRSVRPGRPGVETFLAGIFDATLANVSKDRLLKAFEMRIAVDGAEAPLVVSDRVMTVNRLLDDPDGPASEVAKAVTDVRLSAQTIAGIDPENLETEFHYQAQPLVEVEALLAGIDRPVPVGLGTAYDVAGDPRRWDLRSAFAGLADPSNTDSPFDAELRLRAELREDDPASADGLAISGLRPALADLAALTPLVAPDAPVVTSLPSDGSGSVTSQGFDVVFTDVVDDGSGLLLDGHGIYEVVLTEQLTPTTTGRRWLLYRLDAPGASSVTAHFPDLSPDPSPLVSGGAATTTVRVSAFAWEEFPVFDPMDSLPDVFLWTDIGREAEAYSVSRPVSFTLL